jgi:hypothetical protein
VFGCVWVLYFIGHLICFDLYWRNLGPFNMMLNALNGTTNALNIAITHQWTCINRILSNKPNIYIYILCGIFFSLWICQIVHSVIYSIIIMFDSKMCGCFLHCVSVSTHSFSSLTWKLCVCVVSIVSHYAILPIQHFISSIQFLCFYRISYLHFLFFHFTSVVFHNNCINFLHVRVNHDVLR